MISADELFHHYSTFGFSFSKEILSRYTLSLHSKPFVILTGISGTGKTKIAQLFPIDRLAAPTAPAPSSSPARRDKIALSITGGVRDGDGRGNVANAYMSTIFEPADLAKIEARRQALVQAGRDDNLIDPIVLTVDVSDGEPLQFGVYVQRASSPLIRLRAKSKRGDRSSYDSQPYLRKHYSIGEVVSLEKVGPYHFKIAGATDDQKKQEAADQAEIASTIDRQLFIPVRSDWTDQSEIFGYYDPIAQKYNVTSVLEFLLQARQFPDSPFHLILDEMNLSKVEYYFSDFLSCLESRIKDPNGTVTQASIRLHNLGGPASTAHAMVEEVPESIELPLNLYVTGTVNVDETTYMFSPKVLDRSNVIEFNEVNLSGTDKKTEGAFVLKTLPAFGRHDPITKKDFDDLDAAFKKNIVELNDGLSKEGHQFGYRTAFEMARFINLSGTHANVGEGPLLAALDIQIVQKVLPKFHGSQAELEELLCKLLNFLLVQNGNPSLPLDTYSNDWLAEQADAVAAKSPFRLSLEKIFEMLRDVRIRGFTSFVG